MKRPGLASSLLSLCGAVALGVACTCSLAEEANQPADGDDASNGNHASLRDGLNEFGLTGSLRAGYWSSNRLLDDNTDIATASAWLKFDRWAGPVGLFLEGYLANEDVFDTQQDVSRLREAYIDLVTERWDFRLGRQIIAWGRTDRLNPTDNLTPRDFTLLVPEIDEDRFGSNAARATWHPTESLSLIGVWLTDFQPSVLPAVEVPGITTVANIPSGNDQWALKLDQSGGAIDWSVSWFDGRDLIPDLSPGVNAGVVDLDYRRIEVVGFDAATVHGAYRFATEAAYTRTADPAGQDPFIKNPFFYGVVGIERAFDDDLSVIVQAYYNYVKHHQDPETISNPAVRALAVRQAILANQYDARQYGLSLRIGKSWFNQTLETELATSARLDRDAYSLRPKITYAWSDQVKLITGIDYFAGSDKTLFGLLEKNRSFFAEARYYF